MFESNKNLQDNAVLQSLNVAERVNSQAASSYIFQTLHSLVSPDKAQKGRAETLLGNISSKVAPWVNKVSMDELGNPNSKSEAKSFLSLAVTGMLLKDGDTLEADLSVSKKDFSDLMSENEDIKNLIGGMKNSRVQMGNNVFVKAEREKNFGTSILTNSLNFAYDTSIRKKGYSAVDDKGRKYTILPFSPIIQKDYLGVIFMFGKAPRDSKEHIKNNYKVDNGTLYERRGRKGVWTPVRKDDGTPLKLDGDLLESADYQLSKTGILSEVLKEGNEASERFHNISLRYRPGGEPKLFTNNDAMSEFVKWNLSFDEKDRLSFLQNEFTFKTVFNKMSKFAIESAIYDEGPIYYLGEDPKTGKDVKGTAFEGAIVSGEKAKNFANKMEGMFKNTHNMSVPGGVGKVKKVLDGDTVDIEIAHPTKGKATVRFRVYKLDTPELGDTKGKKASPAEATKAMEMAAEFLQGKRLELTYRGSGFYNRTIGSIKVGGKDFREYMISNGWGIDYDFRSKK